MFRRVIAGLLAAAAFAPAAAVAQDENGRDTGRGQVQRVRERTVDEGQRPQFQRRDEARPQGFQPRPQRQPDQPRPAFDAPAQAGGGWQGRGGWRGRGDAAQQAQSQEARPQQLQPQRDWRQRDRQGFAGEQDRWRRDDTNRATPVVEQRRAEANRRDDQRRWDGNQGWNGDRGWNRDQRWDNNRRYDAPNRNWNNRTDWNRRWRDDNRYDWGRYRQQNRNLFRLPRYYAPYDWTYGYRRFSIGVTLSSLLWSQDYWIDDPWEYRLPPGYGPYRWVRYYNDALLVDIRTGYVVDTVYDIFY